MQFTCFIPDEHKDGGAYRTVTGTVKKIDEFQRVIVLTDGTGIPINEITELNGAMFRSLDDAFT